MPMIWLPKLCLDPALSLYGSLYLRFGVCNPIAGMGSDSYTAVGYGPSLKFVPSLAGVEAYARSLLDSETFRVAVGKVSEEVGEARAASERQILGLLRWFKAELFTWVDRLACEFCEAKDTTLLRVEGASPTEAAGGCARVEVYLCSKCGERSRFPRFKCGFNLADPVAVLKSRRGRCGEFTTGFLSLARSLGYDVRQVTDFEDHVWGEVYLPELKRWVHADPSEGVLDEPLTYTLGWGKRAAIVLAFSAQFGACDVTARYAPDFIKLTIPRRRQKGLSGRLVLEAIRGAIGLANPPSPAALLQRQREEQAELASFVFNPRQQGFHAGRQSGRVTYQPPLNPRLGGMADGAGELGAEPIDIRDHFRTTTVFDSSLDPAALLELSYNGDAYAQDQTIVLTKDLPDQAGSAFLKARIDVSRGFRLRFKFRVMGGGGADGLAVVFQAQGPTALGEGGCGLGYSGIADGLALEFDTYRSFDRCSDPDGNHISLQAGKLTADQKYSPVTSHHNASLGWAPATRLPDFHTGVWFKVQVALLPTGHFQVSLQADDGGWVRVLDIANVDFGQYANGHSLLYLGFSAATGGLCQSHTVSEVEVQLLNPR
ncbi:Peptide-N(4)-(N-acetyl-beta- glucosaminyl)asparagine amidase [Massospora cicadina]|nr:Peptide-N(4)-(N-acetyl-beta- glucosaminyl)asparagine amidase [Massospora cicadina]